MSLFILDGQEYNSEKLGKHSYALMMAFQFAQKEIDRLERKIGVTQTACNAYAVVLARALPKHIESIADGERLIEVNGRKYPLSALSDTAVTHFQALRIANTALADLQSDLAIAKRAHWAYGVDFKAALESEN